MKTFQYRGYTSAGKTTRGLIEALDPKDAREKLKQQGILTQKLEDAALGRKRKGALDLATRALLYRELGVLLNAGLPMDQSFQLLIDTPELEPYSVRLAAARDRLTEGQTLAEALQATGKQVTAFETSVIEVGERSGSLGSTLHRLADFLEQDLAIRDRITTAMAYPIFVLGMALLVAIIMLGVMLPRFRTLLLELKVDLPWLTEAVLAVGWFAVHFGWIILLVLGIGGWFLFRRMAEDTSLKIKRDRLMHKLPLLGPAFESLVNLRFSRTLALLLEGGVPVTESLKLASEASGSPWIAAEMEPEIERVKEGGSIAESIARIPMLQSSLPGWIRAGEASGDLVNLLGNAAQRYERNWDKTVTRSLNLIEPILIMCVGTFVLIIALAILLPVLSMNQALRT